ncbi:MAG: pyridoxamine 5'-phosphate oxidase family protein [Actinomycetota bacterium]|nr:pyridoxamine 5'-phosphate oxidase family protein [Actinomycetota bacterium]
MPHAVEVTGLTGLIETASIGRGECLRLLHLGSLGRVVFTEAAMPAAQPITYVLDREEIVFRADAGSPLGIATRHAVVAFQADDVDVRTRTGWSILGIGETYEVTDLDRRAALGGARLIPWPPTEPLLTIAIRLPRLTGRRLRPAPAAPS